MMMMTITLLSATLLLCCASARSDHVPQPKKVRISSHNMGLVLEWDPPQNPARRPFKFTAEYRGWLKFEEVCVNISSLRCDFTDMITGYGEYSLRVRTELDGGSSDWVETENVTVESITMISAPDVKLQSIQGSIEVDITDPVLRSRNNNLREYYHNLLYKIQYWPEGRPDDSQADKEVLMEPQRRVVLSRLKPEVRYCVQVEIVLSVAKTSQPSNITCTANTASDDVKPWQIVLALVVSFLVVMFSVVFVFIVVWYTYKGIRFLHPQANVPDHFKEYLQCPKSFMFVALDSGPPRELYHQVSSIIPGPDMSDPQQTEDKTYNQIQSDTKECEREQRSDSTNTEMDKSGLSNTENQLLLQ